MVWPSLLTLALLAPAGAPVVTRGPDQWVLRNAHLQCVIARSRGGLPVLVADAAGRVYWRDARLYADWGTIAGGGTIAASHCHDPEMTVVEGNGRVQVTVAGRLLCEGGQEFPEAIRYRITYTLGSGPELGLRLELTTPVERRDASGFLALAMAVPDAREWYAHTLEGVAAERFGAATDRVWQSAEESLDPERPEVGALWADGRRLAVTDLRATGPLENVFWHQARPGEASLFLALLCGSAPHVWSPNAPWTLALRLVTHPE